MVRRSLFMALVLIVAAGSALAVPRMISYQGVVTDNAGTPLEGRHNLIFAVYRDSAGTYPALWTETHTGVPLTNGLFNVILGRTTEIPQILFGNADRWLGITVDTDAEMTPRMRFTSTPWAYRAAIADSALASPGGGGGGWTISGDNMYSAVPGNVGIGNTAPPKKLSIGDVTVLGSEGMIRLQSRSSSSGSNRTWDVGVPNALVASYNYSFVIDDLSFGTDPEFMVKYGNGRVGIGTGSPGRRLHVNCNNAEDGIRIGWGSDYPSLYGDIYHALSGGLVFNSNAGGTWADMQWKTDGTTRMYLTSQGNLGIGTSTPTALLDVAGTAKVQILQITGADVAEKFPVREKAEPGMVVAIDPDRPGELCLARGEYNRRVAGVISGAGNLPVGAVLGNLPGHENSLPLALSGRVWVQCDASGGPIEPGDLLTTSSRPGTAMKASDPSRAPGATIGKAMTSLREGRGLVLTLVSLQ